MNIVKRKSGNGKHDIARRASEPTGSLQQQIDDAFNKMRRAFDEGLMPQLGSWTQWPAVDIAEDEKVVTLRADLPGVEAKDLDVEVSGNALTIRGSRQEEKKEEQGGYRRQERRFGSFSRTISLPNYVDAGKIDARYDKGVLTVTVPKIPGHDSKRVSVRSA